MDPSHNLNALLIGTGEFAFSDGAETLAEARIKGFQDYGNITAFQLQTDVTKLEHKGSYRGGLRKDRTVVTEQGLSYLIKCDEWDKRNLLVLFGGEEAAGFEQPAISAIDACDSWDFTADEPMKVGWWYDIQRPTGERLIYLTTAALARVGTGISCTADASTDKITKSTHGLANGTAITFDGTAVPTGLTAGAVYYVRDTATNDFKVALTSGGAAIDLTSTGTAVVYYTALVEGTDYEVDLTLGRIRFTTSATITSSVQPIVTSAVISLGDARSLFGLTPLQNLTRTGFGRIVCYDQKDENIIVFDHQDFECELSVENAAEINSSSWSEIQLKVTIKGQSPGTVFVRESFEGDVPL